MNGRLWFSLWMNRLWPYNELQSRDELYWYESPSRAIVWRTQVIQVEAVAYDDRDQALEGIEQAFGVAIDRKQTYLDDRPSTGFCLAYRVEALEKMNLPKPAGVRFSQSGWERTERPAIAAWLSGQAPSG